jgi:hypothetical protein
MKPKSYARILEGARRDVRRSPASSDVGEADVHLATRVLADFREVMLEREVSLGAWRGALRGAWICLVVVSLPLLVWANTREIPSSSALEIFVRVEPPLTTFF